MINLLSTQEKSEIRAARLNVQLRKFAFLSFFVALGVLAVYGVGFYFVLNEKDMAERQLNQDKNTVSKYQAVQNEAKAYKANLAIASKVLSSGMSYSTVLTETARILPTGSILTNLALTNIGESATATKSNETTLHARTTSYGGALQIKESLESSALFEKVSLANVTKLEATPESTATERKYPFTVTVSASITKPGAGS